MKTGWVYESEDKGYKEVKISRILQVARPVGIWAKKVGVGLIGISLAGFLWIYWPLLVAEWRYRNVDIGVEKFEEMPVNREIVKTTNFAPTETDNQKFNKYMIYIPKIGAESVVIPNVDPYDKKTYTKALLEGVAEASRLSHPGEVGTTFLFAHSVGDRIDFARYNAVFYLLDKLAAKDMIYISYGGNKYEYEVIRKEILRANDLQYLLPQNSEEKLVLQTCYPPGTSWKRLVVVAQRIAN